MPIADQVQNTAALGQCVRRARKAQGLTLKALGDRAGLGIRFLSEFERGKDTAEVGKVLTALQTLGVKVMLAPDSGSTQDPFGVIPLLGSEPPPAVETGDAGALPSAAPVSVRRSRPAARGDAGRMWDMMVAVGDVRDLMNICGAEPALRQATVFKRALERCFDVLGEAARRVTPQAQARFQRIPWREIITRRNELVMNYERVDHGALYQAAQEGLPELEAELQIALAALDTPVAVKTSEI